MSKWTILLDCDGVLADFISHAIKYHGVKDYDVGDAVSWNFFEDWGITEEEFWCKLDGEEFWSTIPEYPWTMSLINNLRRIENADLVVSTSPPLDPYSVSGKIRWLMERGFTTQDMMIGPKKHLMARPRTILIDDNEKKIEEFGEAGYFHGSAWGILFPQPYNRSTLKDWKDVVSYTEYVINDVLN